MAGPSRRRSQIAFAPALAGLLTIACASRSTPESAAPSPSRAALSESSQARYLLGEARYASGDFMGAVHLWRGVFLELPDDADEERRKLVERMAHTLVQAHLQSGDPGPLLLASRMLDRYIEIQVQALPAGDPRAASLAGCVELLAAVDRQLEALAAASVEAIGDAGDDDADAIASRLATPSVDADADLAPAPEAEPDAGADADIIREIVVPKRRIRHGDTSMIGVRRFFAEGITGASLLDMPPPTVPPQPLVRIARIDVKGSHGDAERRELRRQVRDLVRARRPALRACFEGALARVPLNTAEVVLDLDLVVDRAGDGDRRAATSQRARVRRGVVLDREGDRCVLQALGQGREHGDAAEPVEIKLALTFFLSRAGIIDPMHVLEGTLAVPGSVETP